MNFFIAFYVVTAFLLPLAASQVDNGLTVLTEQGNVTGSLVFPTVRAFLGIPYAIAGRWKPPTSPPIRRATFDATQPGPSCFQSADPAGPMFLRFLGFENNVTESEDCLNLNIWAPSTNRIQATSVLIWIYGGAFQLGTTNCSVYNGKYFVSNHDDITVVTINYRVNIFGQPNAPRLVSSTQSQNFGLLDIEAAIRWVYSNIAAFGGDPNRITLSGQSAGSAAVDAYTYSHPNDTIVKGIITQSGTLDLVTSVPVSRIGVQEADVENWDNVANIAGCGGGPSLSQFACMNTIDAETLAYFVWLVATPFYPIMDDITLFSDKAQRAASGNFLHVPMFGGSTSAEGEIFTDVALGDNSRTPIGRDPVSDLFTQIVFTCPARAAALDRVRMGIPTWRYEYQGEVVLHYPQTLPVHASDIPLVFGTYNATSPSSVFMPVPPSNELTNMSYGPAFALSQVLMSAWVAFTRDPVNGLSNGTFSWPKYNDGGNNILIFGNFSSPNNVTFVSAIPNDAMCGNMHLLQERFKAAGVDLPFIF